jgi:hypothetical protein
MAGPLREINSRAGRVLPKELLMHYGKTSAKIFALVGVAMALLLILRPG